MNWVSNFFDKHKIVDFNDFDYCEEDEFLDSVQSLFRTTGRVAFDQILKNVPKVVYVDGWKTRGSSVMNPMGVLWHWTAATPSLKKTAPSLNVVKNGRTGIPGPLAHIVVGFDGTIYVVASGRANHAGAGHQPLLKRWSLPPTDTAYRNKFKDTGGSGGSLVGVEIENTVGVPFSAAQVDSLGRLAYALQHGLGLSEAAACRWGHIHWTRRKIDLDAVKMAQILESKRRFK